MKKIALLFGLLFASSAFAADNAVIVTPGVGVTMKSKDIGGGVQAMQPVLSDASGNALSMPTAGADAVSNTATGLLGYSRNLVFNGTTWDRWLGDATNGGFVNVKASVLPTGAGTSANQTTINTSIGTTNTNIGPPGATVCATDTGSCSLNALFQRALQTLTTIGTNTGAALPAGTALIGGVELYDSGGVQKATIKAASTAAATGDTSITVQLNPVQPNLTTPLNVGLSAATNAGAAVVKGGVGVVNGGSTYQAVAASQTATVLQTSTGAIGDYLSHCDIYPTSTSPGVVTVFDNTNAAAGSAILFPGGASSLSNLVPFAIPVGAVSTAGAWKVTTGANVSVVCYGKFS